MPSNLEIKSCLNDINEFEQLASKNGAIYIDTLNQIDTYYNIDKGRLKLREIIGKKSELILYNRHGDGVWQSDYIIADIQDVTNLKIILISLFGVKVIVEKSRIYYQFENARIHFDVVTNLGSFIEFEAVILYGVEQAKNLINKLCNIFNIKEKDIIKSSYSDLLIQKMQNV